MNCPYCGNPNEPQAKFCNACGSALTPPAETFYARGAAVGFSRIIDSEPVQAALKKQRRGVRIVGGIMVLLPIVGFLIYGAVSKSMEMGQALLYGAVVSLIILLTTVITSLKQRLDKPFEGVVAEKKKIRRISSTRDNLHETRTTYLLYANTDDGKRLKKKVSAFVYGYLEEGDRIRYLPQFPQPYEKYDKSRDGEVMCMFCGRRNPLGNDSCRFCRNPLIK